MDEREHNKIIGDNLLHYLAEYDKTQLDLAKMIGVSAASVSNWCKGIKAPRMDKIDQICDLFNLRRSELIDQEGPKQRELRKQRDEILYYYEQLNDEGKKKVIEYTADIAENLKYRNN